MSIRVEESCVDNGCVKWLTKSFYEKTKFGETLVEEHVTNPNSWEEKQFYKNGILVKKILTSEGSVQTEVEFYNNGKLNRTSVYINNELQQVWSNAALNRISKHFIYIMFTLLIKN